MRIARIARNDLRRNARTPAFWLLLAVALMLISWQYAALLEYYGLGQAGRQPIGLSDALALRLVSLGALWVLLLTPLWTMQSFAREFSQGTFRMLIVTPLRVHQLLFGKYLAVLALLAIFPLYLGLLVVSLWPFASLDGGQLLTALLGLSLQVAAFAALGVLASLLSASASGALMAGYGLLLFLSLVGQGADWLASGQGLLVRLSWSHQLYPLQKGMLSLPSVGYFLALTLLALTLSWWLLQRRLRPQQTRSAVAWSWRLLPLLAVGAALFWLPSYYWDTTRHARNSLTEESLALLRRLEHPVTLRMVMTQTAALRKPIDALMQRYRRAYPAWRWAYLDPFATASAKSSEAVVYAGDMELAYQGRRAALTQLTEEAIGEALLQVMQAPRHLLFVAGHGEADPLGSANHDWGRFGQQLEKRGYRLHRLALHELAGIPDEVGLIVVAASRRPWLPGEVALLRDWLGQGGNLLWLSEPEDYWPEELAAFLGVRRLPGSLVDAAGAAYGLDSPAYLVQSRYPEHELFAGFDLLTLFAQVAAFEVKDGWQGVPLLSSSDRSWNETGTLTGVLRQDAPPLEQNGPLNFGWLLQDPRGSGRVLLIGDADFLSNAYLDNGGNQDFGLRLVSWLLQDRKRFALPAGQTPDRQLVMPAWVGLFYTLLTLVLIPLALLLHGWRVHRVLRAS